MPRCARKITDILDGLIKDNPLDLSKRRIKNHLNNSHLKNSVKKTSILKWKMTF